MKEVPSKFVLAGEDLGQVAAELDIGLGLLVAARGHLFRAGERVIGAAESASAARDAARWAQAVDGLLVSVLESTQSVRGQVARYEVVSGGEEVQNGR